FWDAAALRLDDAVLDLIAHAAAVASADGVRLEHQADRVAERHPVQRDRLTLFESNRYGLRLDGDALFPERDAHDRLDNRDPFVEELQVLRFVRRAAQVRVGGLRFFGARL